MGWPAGTVTFLFSDLVGASQLGSEHPREFPRWLFRVFAILGGVIETHSGVVFQTRGDTQYAAFARVGDALSAALDGQRAVLSTDWGAAPALRVRMGLNTGDAEIVESEYFGEAVWRCPHVAALGHGGQVLLSAATAELGRSNLPPGVSLRPLGTYRIGNLARPENVVQLVHSDLPAEFPPLRSSEGLREDDRFTAREREVLLLIARGYSNREIAETLVIAPSTAERHVANVLGKLQLSSRAQAAAWVRGANGPFGQARIALT